ncbi:MAG: dCTP deaminase [Planctomycetes bacterium]|nr:dCTP deaminase [Planctomycetota bacterium]
MILCDRETRAAMERGDIGMTPFPENPARWSPSSVDLTLDAEIRPWEPIERVGEDSPIDPASPNFNINALIDRHTAPRDCSGGFILAPGRLVLGWTVEKIRLPHRARIGARVEGKSSLARIGLGVHVTAPTIHPGFGVNRTRPNYPGSPIRLEIWNLSPLHIRLTRGMSICQILFEMCYGTPEQGYSGQHAVQGPSPVPKTQRRMGR